MGQHEKLQLTILSKPRSFWWGILVIYRSLKANRVRPGTVRPLEKIKFARPCSPTLEAQRRRIEKEHCPRVPLLPTSFPQ